MVKTCNKLHLCREFGHCTRTKCTFPHDLNRGQNRRIVEEFNCQSVSSQLLVQIIRLRKSYVRSGSFTQPSPAVHAKEDDIDRQVDVSYPSLDLARQIDMEIIEMLLSSDGIHIAKKLNSGENEYFRRQTIQLADTRGRNCSLRYRNGFLLFRCRKITPESYSYL